MRFGPEGVLQHVCPRQGPVRLCLPAKASDQVGAARYNLKRLIVTPARTVV
jgi:hypothetical protein